MKQRFLLFIFTILFTGILPNVNAQNYHQGDVAVLMEILQNNSTSETNLNWTTESDTSLWTGVSWNNSTPARIDTLVLDPASCLCSTYLAGLLDFSNLDSLKALVINNNEEVTALNVNGLTQLKDLYLRETKVQSLNLSGLSNLSSLHFNDSRMAELDLKGCSGLKIVHGNRSKLTNLDVSQCTNLEVLEISNNKLATLNIAGLQNLAMLNCSNNLLGLLDASDLPRLELLNIGNNGISDLNVSNDTSLTTIEGYFNNFGDLDLSTCKNLVTLNSWNSGITTLNVTGLDKLSGLMINNNKLDTLDLNGCSSVSSIDISDNHMKLTSIIPLTNLPSAPVLVNDGQDLMELIELGGTLDYSNQFKIDNDTTIFLLKDFNDVVMDSNRTGVFTIDTSGMFYLNMTNQGQTIVANIGVTNVIPNSGDIAILETIRDNNFTATSNLNWSKDVHPFFWDKVRWDTSGRVAGLFFVDYNFPGFLKGDVVFSGLDSLKTLDIDDNHDITGVDLSGLTALENLQCDRLSVITLDLTGLTNLGELKMNYAPHLKEINFTGCKSIYKVTLRGCKALTTLDVSGITSLNYLNTYICSNLENINISGCTNLNVLFANYCNLSSVEFTGCTNLEYAYFEHNKLTSLDLSELSALIDLRCDYNNLETLNISGLTNLTGIDAKANLLTLSQAAPAYNHPGLTTSSFEPQFTYEPMYIPVGSSVDFSSEASININGADSATTFTLFDFGGTQTDQNQTGIFTIGTPGKYYVGMFNSNVTVYSDFIHVIDGSGINVTIKDASLNVETQTYEKDFGKVDVSQTKIDTLIIRNPGTVNLEVSDITLPVGYSVVTKTFSIAAGSEHKEELVFAPTSVRPYEGEIVVHSNASMGDSTATVLGQGITRIIGLEGDMDHGGILVGISSLHTLSITNTGSENIIVSDITVPEGYSVNKTSFGILPFASYDITVTFTPEEAITYNGTLTVTSNASEGVNTIDVTGYGFGRILSLDGDMNFGDVAIGSNVKKSLTVSNTGSDPLIITDITVPDDYSVSHTSFTVEANSTFEVEVALTPTQVLNYNGTLTVSSNATSGTDTISLSGNGVASSLLQENTETTTNVYPNPVKDVLYLEGVNKNSDIEIYSTLGNLVATEQCNSEDTEINVSDLENGIYILRVTETDESIRFIKQ